MTMKLSPGQRSSIGVRDAGVGDTVNFRVGGKGESCMKKRLLTAIKTEI